MAEIRYLVEAKPCSSRHGETPTWNAVSIEYADRSEAEREWHRLNDLYGHDTYHRLVKVKRKVLKEA